MNVSGAWCVGPGRKAKAASSSLAGGMGYGGGMMQKGDTTLPAVKATPLCSGALDCPLPGTIRGHGERSQ